METCFELLDRYTLDLIKRRACLASLTSLIDGDDPFEKRAAITLKLKEYIRVEDIPDVVRTLYKAKSYDLILLLKDVDYILSCD